ncbi:atrial natriuretic peptide receptor 1-like isoform X3 [Bolinopsis microptera]|uniref:atrial natriuretic peptide receptor 1-like isoform X3 n=1 Tax=Bolinopsis microptera TaxID=2820187 RepID=UPI003079397B
MLLWVKTVKSVLLFLSLFLICQQKDISLGILVPWTGASWDEGPRAIAAAYLAINEINENSALLPGYKLVPQWRDDACSVPDSLANVTDLWSKNVDAFIGPACSVSCEQTGHLAAHWNLPMISWACASPALSDKKTYPTFVRTAGPYKTLGKPFTELMKHYKWYRCAIISANQNLFAQSARHIQKVLEKEKVSDNPEDCKPGSDDCQISVVLYKQFYSGKNPGANQTLAIERNELMKEIKEKARIIFILGYTDDVRDFLLRAEAEDMLNGYVWVGVDILGHKASGWMGGDGAQDERAKRAFQGFMSYTVRVPNTPIYRKFEADLISYTKEHFNITPSYVSTYAQNLYDAVYLYALSLKRLFENEPGTTDVRQGKKLAQLMMNYTFDALGRKVLINSEGDRESDYEITSYQGDSFEGIGSYISVFNNMTLKTEGWEFPGNRSLDDTPTTCGDDGFICIDPEHNSPDKYVIAIVAVLLVIVIICVAIFIWRRHEQAERDKKLWIIPKDDLQMVGSKFRSSLSLNGDETSNKSAISLVSNMDQVKSNGDKAIYKGQLVSVSRLAKNSVAISPTIIKEFKTVRELSHENVNPILGACPEPGSIMIVSGVMGKGTLQDILSDEKITLDDMFKSSMIGDAAKALEYIHKSVLQYHGNLSSNSLGVDSHWVLKISDYGLRDFRAGCMDTDETEDHKYTSKLWRAPEFILSENDFKGSQKGDIYSFAIIINEILTRQYPFETYSGSPKDSNAPNYREIVERISTCEEPPCRPELEENNNEQLTSLQKLVREMWSNNDLARPDIGVIRRRLKHIYPEKSRSITERVIMMMEKYAANLEIKVDERTAELQIEKHKADQLLYRMLPRAVAEKMKQGQSIRAELFDTVTVYFSDVVSFTNLCSQSTPMEVVAFLDDMYTMFDSIIESYDVYKVETIGDAYMLVSGLPDRNGDSHVIEITETALALIEGTRNFKVRHKPGYQMQIRVGIHSGPCCAGVVGKLMPRYCLFGDTINTASRMESNGMPMRVHMSQCTYELLEQYDCYNCSERGGTIEVKGKGAMKTYFCDGIDDTKFRPKLVKSTVPALTPASDASKRGSQVRPPPKGYRPLPRASPNGSITRSPGANKRANKSCEPLLRELNNLEDSAV